MRTGTAAWILLPPTVVTDLIVSTEIDAPAATVWSLLTDLPRFHEWNPFIREASGSLEVGDTVRVSVRPSFGFRLGFSATVLAREDNRLLRWRGHVGSRWLAGGDHTFSIEPIGPDRVRFTQREVFTGVVPRIAARLLARQAGRGFQAMNHALKTRAERARPARSEPVRAVT